MLTRRVNLFSEKIYYLDKEISDKIGIDFNLIDQKSWYELYQRKVDQTYWRLDRPDKFHTQFFVQLDNLNNWDNYDSSELQINLLLKTRGNTMIKCIWAGCNKMSLKNLAYCEIHAYKEMGFRK